MDRALWFRSRLGFDVGLRVAARPYSRRGCGFNSRRRPPSDLSGQKFPPETLEPVAGGGGRSERRALPCQPQDDVAVALARPSQMAQPVDNRSVEPDQALALSLVAFSKPTLPSESVLAIASNAA
jgi:hypothetical protein